MKQAGVFYRSYRVQIHTLAMFAWLIVAAWWAHPIAGCVMIAAAHGFWLELTKTRGSG